MKLKILVVGGAALAAATLTTAFFYDLLSDQAAERQAGEEIAIAVADRDLPSGDEVAEDDLRWELWDAGEAPADAIVASEEIVGKRLATEVRADMPLLSKYLPDAAGGGMANAIPPGMRAVTLHVNEWAGVNELVEMGDRVDVLVSNRPRTTATVAVTMETVLEDVEVLTSGLVTDSTRPRETPTVTVLVSAEDAERVSLADQAGDIRLTLRNPADREELHLSDARSAVAGDAEPTRRRLAEDAPATTAAAAPRVVFSVRLASLSDRAVRAFSARLEERRAANEMTVAAFRPGRDVGELLEALRSDGDAEVFADPRLSTLAGREAVFEQRSEAAVTESGAPSAAVAVRVALEPELQRDGSIVVRVATEASRPASLRTWRLADDAPEGVAVRRSDYAIRVVDGQSFWIRGLLERSDAREWLRRLFPRRRLARDAHEEIVLLVTPRLQTPAGLRDTALAGEMSAALQR